MIREELGKLARHSAIYGVADFIPYIINFLLLPVFTAILAPSDYGALSILLLFGVLTKIFFRSGLDSGFFRIYYEQETDQARKALATTLFGSAFSLSLVLFTACAVFAEPIGRVLLGADADGSNVPTWVVLVALDTLLNTFAFVPMNLFRMTGNPGAFTLVTLFRSAVNLTLKVVLVVSGWGVSGVLWADAIASFVFVLALSPILLRNLTPHFSGSMLRQALAFGLPKMPHGLAHQILNLSDRKLIEVFLDLAASGLYHIGYMMGTGVKFFLSAFELAWAPLVYSQLERGEDAARNVLARLATYAFVVLMGFGLLNAVFGRELLWLMAEPEYHDAHAVIPIVVLAYMIQGLFALTSIGIGISKKTTYFPVITLSAATLNMILNILWIPRYGIEGAAWATVAGYGLMAVLGLWFANRHFPIPYEWGRIARVSGAGGVSYGLSLFAPMEVVTAIGVKTLTSLAFPALLYALGFFRPDELAWIRDKIRGPKDEDE